MAGAALLLALMACAAVPQWIAPYPPDAFDYRALLQQPSPAHPFGTDNFGRDVLSRTIWATRIDLQIAIFGTLFPAVFGTFVGALIGYVGGMLDMLFRRLVDLLISYWDQPNIFVVGDDDQSNYRFQGANVENMRGFAGSYAKELLTVVLTHNYR